MQPRRQQEARHVKQRQANSVLAGQPCRARPNGFAEEKGVLVGKGFTLPVDEQAVYAMQMTAHYGKVQRRQSDRS